MAQPYGRSGSTVLPAGVIEAFDEAQVANLRHVVLQATILSFNSENGYSELHCGKLASNIFTLISGSFDKIGTKETALIIVCHLYIQTP